MKVAGFANLSLRLALLLSSSLLNTSCGNEVAPMELDGLDITTPADWDLQEPQGTSEWSKTDWMTDWVPPERLKQWFPTFRLGTDDGVAIYLSLYGRYAFHKLLDEGSDEEKANLDKYFDYINDKFLSDDKANGGNGVIYILDFDGFTITNYARPAVTRLALRQLSKAGKVHKAFRTIYSINTNFAAEIFLNTVKPHLGKILENLQVYGT